MHAIVGAADAAREPFIALLGDDQFDGRFGFTAASSLAIDAPDHAWGAHFQVRLPTDRPAALGGAFRYAGRFADM